MDKQPEEVAVGVAAARVGLTVRTLHHWDRIGLASPSGRSSTGYRLYGAADLERLRRVVAYREAGLSLEEIGDVLAAGSSDVGAMLRKRRVQLASEMESMRRRDERLARLVDAHERGVLLTGDEQRAAFGEGWRPEWLGEARARWGDSAQWAQFAEGSAGRTADQWRAQADAMKQWERDAAEALGRGTDPDGDEARVLADRYRAAFSNWFPITRAMQVCLGRLFESDEGFAAYYDRLNPGLAGWIREAFDEAARAEGLDPDEARWE
ncbi:MerR family transcriptional regulator [Luteococcus sp. H138]|uniref:MerR family transcriptional regulator n=1 Tax=unclassified Luteococcus TaxID=2639923 RepID=UPI00313EA686